MLEEAAERFADDPSLTTPERDFLSSGRRLERHRRRMRIVYLLLVIAAIIALPISYFIGRDHIEAQDRRRASAMQTLSNGDLPATLLWMQERNRKAWPIEHLMFKPQASDPKAASLAQSKCPGSAFALPATGSAASTTLSTWRFRPMARR